MLDLGETASLLVGASESVDLLVTPDPSISDMVVDPKLAAIKELSPLIDQRLDGRCAVFVDLAGRQTDPVQVNQFGRELEDHGWEVRFHPTALSSDCLIIDSEEVITGAILEGGGHERIRADSERAKTITSHFDLLWADLVELGASKRGGLIYEDVVASSEPATGSVLVTATEEKWRLLIRELAQNPGDLHGLDPREFEELVEQLLMQDGCQTKLTPPKRDGGRDVLAWFESPAGTHLYLAECKRYSPENPVGVERVRALAGVVQADKATAGFIVTTSRLTSGALNFVGRLEYQLGYKEYDDVVEWIRKYARR